MRMFDSFLNFIRGLRNYDYVPSKDHPMPVRHEPDPEPEVPEAVARRGWSKSLDDCHPRLQEAWPVVKDEWEASHPGWTLKLDYTYRSPEFQFELYKKGRKLINGQWVVVDRSKVVTDKDGKNLSHHNVYPSQALDMYIVDDKGKIVWESEPLYTELGDMWTGQGMVSGAVWKYRWHDWSHVQMEYQII